MPTRVFLDTDAGNEVDDQFAIAYAVRHPALEVVGIGAAFFTHLWDGKPRYSVREGSMETAFAEATTMLRLLDRSDIPVHRGLRGRLGTVDGDEDAARAIIELAQATDDPLHVISIGVESNLALALRIDPAIAGRIRVVFIDGDYPWRPAIAYNLPNDLEAFQSVLDSDCDYLHVPAPRVSRRLTVNPGTARRLFPDGDPAGDYLASLLDAACEPRRADPEKVRSTLALLFEDDPVEFDDFPLWDLAAIVAVARPDLVTVVEDGAPLFEPEEDPDAEWTFRVTPRPTNPRRIRVVSDIDVEGVWADYRTVMRAPATAP